MFIKIDLNIASKNYSKKFPININDLENAVKTCYMGLGTLYQPIDADNFINLGNEIFPEIFSETEITLNLQPDDEDDSTYISSTPKLICCKVKNVGRAFNDQDIIPKDYWSKIFDCNSDYILSAPDGTLYISPNEHGKCSISTKKQAHDSMVAYSVLFSFIIEREAGYKRPYYFVLDPVVKIRSTPADEHDNRS